MRIVDHVMRVLSVAVAVMAIACTAGDPHKGRILLAEVDGMYLYKDEVDLMYAANGQGTDSLEYVDRYIKSWAKEMLFYSKALENVATDKEIDARVELYRKNLILNEYQERLVVQQLEPALTVDDVLEFYKENIAMFEVDEPMIKGYYLKVPSKSPRMHELRRWCLSKSAEDFEKIEKYCLSKDAVFECFFEEWLPLDVVAAKTPLTVNQLKDRLARTATIEFSDNGHVYFVSADTMVVEGDDKPVEMVTAEIRKLLLNSRMAGFIKERKQELYNEALQKKGVKLYNK
jgi:hypothetical protein